MAWFKIEAKLPQHAKYAPLTDAAFRLAITAGAWCAQNMTDGWIPKSVVATLTRAPSGKRLASVTVELISSGIWEDHGDRYAVHDFLVYNISRADWEAKVNAGSAGGRAKAANQSSKRLAPARESLEHLPDFCSSKTLAPPLADHDHDHEIQKQSLKPYCQSKDLTGYAPRAASAPRHDNTTELESEADQTEATPARLPDTETRLQEAQAQREPPEPKPASERQPVALPTRAARVRSELSELPIGELAKRWRENPTWVSESSPQTRPEMLAAAKAWDTAVGLRPTPLGHPGRDPCSKALLELYADGVPQSAILRACEQAGRTDWLCGRAPDYKQQTRKRRVSTLTMGVLRELLDAAPSADVIGVSPAVAALIAERKKATG